MNNEQFSKIMKKHSPRNLQWKALATALLAFPLLSQAQVSLYQFSQSVGTYTPITAADGGVALGVPTYWPHVNNNRAWVNNPFNDPDGQVTQGGYFSPAEGPGYPIGFDFTFNGDVFDVIGISNGGWISFGKSSDGLQAVWVYNYSGTTQGDPFVQFVGPGAVPGPTPSYRRNRVAGFGNSSLQQVDWTSLVPPGQYSQLRMATIGTAPNRVCVVQWEDYGLRNDVTVARNKINFQIRLNEIDNSVEVVFGPQDWVSDLGRYQRTQCGLSGRAREDFNGRTVPYEEPAFLYDWNATVAADDYLDYCQFTAPQFNQPNGSGIQPVEGLTWRWDPPVCPPPAWPLAISDISFEGATATWQEAPGAAGEYEWFLSTENDVNGPEVASDFTTDPEIYMEGLDPLTDYYLFIRSICDDGPGVWSMATHFRTIGGGVIECNGGSEIYTYCSHQNDVVQWYYISSDGSPLQLELLDGYRGQVSEEHFTIWDAPGGNQLYNAPAFTNVGGITLPASPSYFIELATGAGACGAQEWYLPYKWRIGCKNCTDPLVNFTLGDTDCVNQQFYVNANVFSMGTATSLVFTNNAGGPDSTFTASGNYVVGPYPVGTSVIITAQDAEHDMCYSQSVPFIEPPCPVEDCGPATYNYCHGNDEHSMWAYQGANGSEIGIRFLQGGIGLGDHLYVYNGLDVGTVEPVEATALPNKLYTSGAPSIDRALVMELVSDNQYSCADTGMYGYVAPWQYIVACYDGCVQPKATFADSCISATAFMVNVKVTELGSTGSVTITSSSGSAPVTATALGTWPVGPFQANVPVTIDVEGASVLCTYTSIGRTKDCSGWSPDGISEMANAPLRVFPNPSNGTFQLELPQGSGIAGVEILDLTGRTVARQAVHTNNTSTTLHLEHLPNGLYTVTAQGRSTRYVSKISIQH